MQYDYDIIIIGGGPGGYVGAIRATQLGKKVAIVEKDTLGGICANWGCIPTKALLKNAKVLDVIKDANKFGIEIPSYKVNWNKIVQRSRNISKRLSKGVEFLMKKNKIDYIAASASFINKNTLTLNGKNINKKITANHIIISTGTIQKNLPGLAIDGKQIISSREAMILDKIPKNMVVIGAGAIGVEFAHLYNTFGTDVTLIEGMPNILPNEDIEISKELESIFSKRKIKIFKEKMVEKVTKTNKSIKLDFGSNSITTDLVLVAVGVTGNVGSIALDKVKVSKEKGFIKTNGFMQTNIDNIYAIGDVCGPPLLAHVASAEAIIAVEHICGIEKCKKMKYDNIPGCTYCEPEIASVGLTEQKAIASGYDIKVGKFPFRSLGKSLADGNHEGFVKIIYDAKYGELLGCHIIGHNASNLISEISIARTLETTYNEILNTIHPHPTLSEAIHEATGDAFDEAIHI